MARLASNALVIQVLRTDLFEAGTVGKVFVDGTFLWWSLEDRLHSGPKIPGDTCIPAGRYRVIITYSYRFQRMLPLLLNVPNFSGIRIHPGNTTQDTSGCLLVGGGYQPNGPLPVLLHSRVACDRLQGAIQSAIDAHKLVYCEIYDPETIPEPPGQQVAVV